MKSEMKCQEAKFVRPVIVEVTAKTGCDGVEFGHEWRFEDETTKKKGEIDVPAGAVDTDIQFHFKDDTKPKLNLKFKSEAKDAMWVARDECPRCAGDGGGQINFPHKPSNNLLKVVDLNSEECLLKYALRFDGDPSTGPDGKPCPPYVYDPGIKNGGTNVL